MCPCWAGAAAVQGWQGAGGAAGARVPHPCPPQQAQGPHFHLLEIPAQPLRDPRRGETDTAHSGPLWKGSGWGGGHRCSPLVQCRTSSNANSWASSAQCLWEWSQSFCEVKSESPAMSPFRGSHAFLARQSLCLDSGFCGIFFRIWPQIGSSHITNADSRHLEIP